MKRQPIMPAGASRRSSGGARAMRMLFRILAAAFVLCVLVQVFFAGLSIFAGESWENHTSFIHMFEFLPLLMFILSFFGRVRSAARWLSLVIFLLIIAQYATANAADAKYLAAIHPVIALVIFWMSIDVLRRSGR